MGGENLKHLFDSMFFEALRTCSTRPSCPVKRGRADPGRLRRVTARPVMFIILVSLKCRGSGGFELIVEGLEAEIFDFSMVWESYWKARG